MTHLSTEELTQGLDDVRRSPADVGTVEMIVRRPDVGDREELPAGELTREHGLAGDNWRARGSRHTPDNAAEPGRQLTLMNARAIALFAGSRERWALAGDQLYVDLDLSVDNLPAGTRLRLGGAVVEVSPLPHTGSAKFRDRFGIDASRFVNSPEGSHLRLRGINALVVEPGPVRAGDIVSKIDVAVTA